MANGFSLTATAEPEVSSLQVKVLSALFGLLLVTGVVVGVVQAATQLNEPTIAFIAKAAALTLTLFALGNLLLGHMVQYTTLLFQRIPHLIG